VKEPRLAGISTVAAANRFLEKNRVPKMNKKFFRPPSEKEDTRVPPGEVSLKDISCSEFGRTAGNNHVVRYEKRLFQILKTGKSPTKDKVIIRITPDENLSVLWKETKLPVKELTDKQGQKDWGAAWPCDIST
jgi:hypothetical protein